MLTTVKVLLTITDSSKDQLLQTLIKSMSQKVKNYCNRTDLPLALEDIVAEMVVALYKKEYGVTTIQSGASVPTGSVKKEAIGDYSIEYNVSGSSSSSSDSSSTTVLNDFRAQLNAFRKIKFV